MSMNFVIADDPARDEVILYLRGDGYVVTMKDPLAPSRDVHTLQGGDEAQAFLRLNVREYAALERAVLERAAPFLAERNLLMDSLTDARTLRDRLLTMLERQV